MSSGSFALFQACHVPCLAKELELQAQCLEAKASRDMEGCLHCSSEYSLVNSDLSETSFNFFEDPKVLAKDRLLKDMRLADLDELRSSSTTQLTKRMSSSVSNNSTILFQQDSGCGSLLTMNMSTWQDEQDVFLCPPNRSASNVSTCALQEHWSEAASGASVQSAAACVILPGCGGHLGSVTEHPAHHDCINNKLHDNEPTGAVIAAGRLSPDVIKPRMVPSPTYSSGMASHNGSRHGSQSFLSAMVELQPDRHELDVDVSFSMEPENLNWLEVSTQLNSLAEFPANSSMELLAGEADCSTIFTHDPSELDLAQPNLSCSLSSAGKQSSPLWAESAAVAFEPAYKDTWISVQSTTMIVPDGDELDLEAAGKGAAAGPAAIAQTAAPPVEGSGSPVSDASAADPASLAAGQVSKGSSANAAAHAQLAPAAPAVVLGDGVEVSNKTSKGASGKRGGLAAAVAAASPQRGKKRTASPFGGYIPGKLAPCPPGHCCSSCGSQSTPVWRAGPAGPKTLCNACGVRYMKVAKKK